jgi:hypothetical protein
VIVGRLDQRAAETLVRALCMIVSHILADEFSQMRLTKRDDAVEALLQRVFKSMMTRTE